MQTEGGEKMSTVERLQELVRELKEEDALKVLVVVLRILKKKA